MLKSLEKDPVITDPRIWLASLLTMVPLLVMFFKPTLLEFLGFYLIDTVAYIICQLVDIRVFRHYWPDSRLFFPALDPELLQIKDLPRKRVIYQSILDFPRDRSLSIGLLSVLKVLPSFAFVYPQLLSL